MTRAAGKSICHPCPIGTVRFLFPEGLRRLLPHPVCRPDEESCCRSKGPALLRTEFSRAHLPPACLLRPLHTPGLFCVAPGRGQGRCVCSGLVRNGEENTGSTLPPALLCLSENKGGPQHLLPWMPFYEGLLTPKTEGPMC